MSSWLQRHPRLLDAAYKATDQTLQALAPLLKRIGFERLAGIFQIGEQVTKGPLFDCRMCGQCTLHSTGMTCPMTCPKEIRNGPCGGVRPDGGCEIVPDMTCVWVQAWERADRMGIAGQEIALIQPPLDRRMKGTSAWLNVLDGRANPAPVGWQPARAITIDD